MSNSDTSPLFRLIKSLTPSEKRYFKVVVPVFGTNNNLMVLFDLMDKQSQYDEKALVKKLQSKSIKGSWPLLQNRLSALVLKSLRQFHSKSNVENQLHNMLIEIDVLYRKKLFDICLKNIQKAKKLALKHESQLVLLKLLKWESILQKEKGKHLQKDVHELEEMYRQEGEVLERYKRYTTYKFHLFNYLLMSRNRMLPEANKELVKYDELLASEPYVNPDKDITLDEQILLFGVKGIYYINKGDMVNGRKVYIEFCDLIENCERGVDHLRQEYFTALNNLLIPQALVRDLDGFRETINKLHTRFEGHREFDKDLFAITTCYEFGIYHELGDFDKMVEILPYVEEGLKRFDQSLNPINKYVYLYNVALTYFHKKEYSQGIRWLNNLLNDHDKRPNQLTSNLYYFGLFLSLVLHYEADNTQWLEHQVPSVVNLLNGIRKLNTYEKLILSFFQADLSKQMSSRERLEQFQLLHTKLLNFKGESHEKGVLRFFDFEKWAESKLSQKTMYQIVQEKLAAEPAFEA